MKRLLLVAPFVLVACAPVVPRPTGQQAPSAETLPPLPVDPPASDEEARIGATLEQAVAERLGLAVLSEAASAPTSILYYRSISLPPPGYVPSVIAAFRTWSGWVRIDAGGRGALSPVVAAELERVLAQGAWSRDPAIPPSSCLDGSGTIVQVRDGSRRRTTAHPCGRNGDSGLIGEWVAANRITDFNDLPLERRPANYPLQRLDARYGSIYRFSSGINEERLITLRNQREWEGQWYRITSRHGNPPGPPLVEFTTHMVLLAAMGARPSGGYSVSIDRVSEQPDELQAFVTFTSPGPRCGNTAAITHPADIALVRRSDKPVRFLVNRVVRDCP